MEGTLEEPPVKDSSRASPDKLLKGMLSTLACSFNDSSEINVHRSFCVYFVPSLVDIGLALGGFNVSLRWHSRAVDLINKFLRWRGRSILGIQSMV